MEKASKLKMKRYQKVVLAVLNEEADERDENYKKIVIADKEKHHYQLLSLGWSREGTFYDNILVHFHIKPDGKIWLLENNTAVQVAKELTNLGVPKTDIVLGFQPPQYRQYTEYGVG